MPFCQCDQNSDAIIKIKNEGKNYYVDLSEENRYPDLTAALEVRPIRAVAYHMRVAAAVTLETPSATRCTI